MKAFDFIYNIFWGDLFTIPLPNGNSLGVSLLVFILVPLGVYFTIRTLFLPIRFFPEMVRLTMEKKNNKDSVSGLQTLIVATATRVGMGNLIGVVAAISIGGAGSVFWMWFMALLGSSTAFVEATLAQIHKEKDPVFGGYRGGPSYYLHSFFARGKKKSILGILFAISALICFCGIMQVTGNSVSDAFESAFNIPPIVSTVILVVLSALVIFKKKATLKILDIIVPIMAIFYIAIALFVFFKNITAVPAVFERIFAEAFGLRQIAGGGIGTVLVTGIKRGLFSNEAGSGSAPCAAATADVSHPAKSGLIQALGVLIDTIVICSCTVMIMLLAPESVTTGLEGMKLLNAAMNHHLGYVGVIFISISLWLFSFSTFIGLTYYARPNLSYLFGDSWKVQYIYKFVSLVMLFMGGLAAYSFVWKLSDVGLGLMTVFNAIALVCMSGQAMKSLSEYQNLIKKK